MNFKIDETPTKLRGGYYTDPDIAAFLLKWVLSIHPKSILEPSCGDGVFLRGLSKLNTNGVKLIQAFEIEPAEAEKAKESASDLKKVDVQITTRDFLGWSLIRLLNPPQFDAVVGNPPFIRYQYLDSDLQGISEQLFKVFHLPFTKHTNAWVPFVISSLVLLRPGGRLAMVVPSELLHVLHAESLRLYLAKVCSRVLIFDPQELWFEGTLQGAILLLAEKKNSPEEQFKGISIIPTRSKDFLSENPEDYFEKAKYTNGETVKGKWMLALLTSAEREVLSKAKANSGVYHFDAVADVAVGIVTGANNFFLVPDSIVKQYSLKKWAHPMFGRSGHVPGVVFDDNAITRNKELGVPTNFLWFSAEEPSSLPDDVKTYIGLGEKEGLHKRYKCRIREPWFSVPSVYATSIGMPKRSHNFPRLIFNKAQAYTTDTTYRVRYKKFDEPTLVYSFVNSLTALTAEVEGRHYGGGVLELVPSEIRKLLVPIRKSSEKAVYDLNASMQNNITPEALLTLQDEKILIPLGFSKHDSYLLLQAWSRLRLRRQRQDPKEMVEED
ncbi:MAG: putative modification methylase [Anaerolineaceae bacterium]|nr:MAG: putative modification methylase [Anaerolineaceae bacterium]